MNGQRLIGMLGGMSWESSAEYYRLANELTRDRLGGLHSARLILSSVDFAPIEELQVSGDWERAGEILAGEARGLEAAGAELLVLCTNTMHIVAEQVQGAVSIPFLDLLDVTADAIAAQGLIRLGLLATGFTMEHGFYQRRMAQRGLQVITPGPAQRAEVHRVIYEELCLGIVRDESRVAYRRIIDELVSEGAQGIILGCTEIELLIGPDDSPVPVFATTRLHVEAVLDASLVVA